MYFYNSPKFRLFCRRDRMDFPSSLPVNGLSYILCFPEQAAQSSIRLFLILATVLDYLLMM